MKLTEIQLHFDNGETMKVSNFDAYTFDMLSGVNEVNNNGMITDEFNGHKVTIILAGSEDAIKSFHEGVKLNAQKILNNLPKKIQS